MLSAFDKAKEKSAYNEKSAEKALNAGSEMANAEHAWKSSRER